MLKRLLAATALALVFAAAASAQPAAPPLIARSSFFGNPARVAARLSPDGRSLAWIAPRDRVLNIWVAPIGDPSHGRPLTQERARPIREYFWAPDSSSILFVNDTGGDKNYKLFDVDIASDVRRSLTPFDKTRVEVIGVSDHVKDHILIGLNNRDPKWHDVYLLDLKSGKLASALMNTGK